MPKRSHGQSLGPTGATPEYSAWRSMLTRCRNPKNKRYKDYGGRGITVCPEWEASFEKFLADVGPRPSSDHSLDRKDNNGNYEPGNVCWATRSEQQNNRRGNRVIEYNGQKKTAAQWAKTLGLCYPTFTARLRLGWSIDKIVSTPVMKQFSSRPEQ